MFYGNVNCKEDISFYPKALQKALKYLKETDLLHMAPGKYPIDDDMNLIVSEITTQQREQKRPEVHRDYLDVQFVISGCEKDYFFMDMGDNVMDEDAFADRDVAFYKKNAAVDENYVVMHPGNYAIFFPADVHVPACSVGQDAPVKKAIMKVKMSAL